jgi:integrase
MASMVRDPGGRKRILFVDADGNRRAIFLGKMTKQRAMAVKIKVEALAGAKLTRGTVEDEVSRWVADLPNAMHSKLARVGLVEPRAAVRSVTLGELIDLYCESRAGSVKSNTALVWEQAKQTLLAYFGADKPIREIHEGDAELWAAWMVKQGWAEATRRKRSQNAKQFYRFAIRQRLAASNPFADLKSSAVGNDKRLYFVTLEDFAKVMDEATDGEWRLILALARFGGLRVSEIFGLKWTDIDWAKGTILIRSSKTEKYDTGTRLLPIFGELLPYLQDAFEQAAPGAVHCIERHRIASANLRTTIRRFIVRAGLTPWERTLQNLRSSREVELSEQYPMKTVTAWLGHSLTTAAKHYLTVPREHFERARQTAQNSAQSVAEHPAPSREAQNPTRTESLENADMLVLAGTGDNVPDHPLAPRGFEPLSPG